MSETGKSEWSKKAEKKMLIADFVIFMQDKGVKFYRPEGMILSNLIVDFVDQHETDS